MANYVVSDTSLGSVADAIRTKGGTSAPLEYPQGFIDAIDAISGGGDEPVPEDGKTRIFIHIAEGTPDNRLTFYLRFTASTANNTTVDWGDGVSETLGSTDATIYLHKYAQGGDYIITVTVNSGTVSFDGTTGSFGQSIYGTRATRTNKHNAFRIRRVIFGDNIDGNMYYTCYDCGALDSFAIPNNIASIGDYAFYYCYYLTSITIPNNVTSIGQYAFYRNYSMSEIHLKPTEPPTLANSNVFSEIPSDCIIYVPQGSLSAYQQATNWSQYSSKMQEEPT